VTDHDEAFPEVDEVLQYDDPHAKMPVRIDEPVRVQDLPAQASQAFTTPLTTSFARVLPADPTRARATLICSVAWEYSRGGASGSGCPWPANVALVIRHADQVQARVPTSTGTLTTISESWTR